MRNVSLLLAAEDNPLVKKFLDNVYPHLPDDLIGYYNQSFDLETDFQKTVEEVKRNMLFCRELTTQPDFDINLTINTLDEIISNGRKMLEFVETNGIPINPELRPYLDNEYKYSDQKDLEAFRISDETQSLRRELNIPDDLFSWVFLRAYCEYLKAEALKQPSEQPSESADDIEPPDYVLKVFQKAINEGSVALSEKPINGKKRFLFLRKNMKHFYIDKDRFSYVTKDFLMEWLYDSKGKQRGKGYYNSNFSFD